MKTKHSDCLEGLPYKSGIKALVVMGGKHTLDDALALPLLELSDDELACLERIINDSNHPWMREHYRRKREFEARIYQQAREDNREKEKEEELENARKQISNWNNLGKRLREIALIDIGGGMLCGFILFMLIFGVADLEGLWIKKNWPDKLVPILALTTMVTISSALFALRLASVSSAKKLLKQNVEEASNTKEG